MDVGAAASALMFIGGVCLGWLWWEGGAVFIVWLSK